MSSLRMRSCLLVALSALGWTAWAGAGAGGGAARAGNGSLESYTQARKAVEAGIEALGGRDRLRRSQEVSWTETGSYLMRNESARVDPPWDRQPVEARFHLEAGGQRQRVETR